jgi:transcriptional regulator of arginine metabolism
LNKYTYLKNKTDRHQVIHKLITEDRISSQEKLLELLREKGYNLTQATLSRDLKVMQVAKVADGSDGYVYVMPGQMNKPAEMRDPERINFLADGFRGIRFSGNLSVIRTLPGYASSIAAVIDNASPWEIIGTIAGDDTILVILKEGVTRNEMMASLKRIMPFIKNNL